MVMKSQVDKFNAKMAKRYMDDKALGEPSLEKELESKEPKVDATRLKEQGNIKEAAMVLSYDGMEAFSRMFGNSMENAVTNVLNNRMEEITKGMESKLEDILNEKLLEVMEGISKGVNRFLEGTSPSVDMIAEDKVDEITANLKPTSFTRGQMEPLPPMSYHLEDSEIEDSMTKLPEVNSEVKVLLSEIDPETRKKLVAEKLEEERKMKEFQGNPKPETKSNKVGYRRIGTKISEMEEVIPSIIQFLKIHKKPVKLAEISDHLKDTMGVVLGNATVVMNRLLSFEPNVEKKGFGLYGYEEKTFKSPINLS